MVLAEPKTIQGTNEGRGFAEHYDSRSTFPHQADHIGGLCQYALSLTSQALESCPVHLHTSFYLHPLVTNQTPSLLSGRSFFGQPSPLSQGRQPSPSYCLDLSSFRMCLVIIDEKKTQFYPSCLQTDLRPNQNVPSSVLAPLPLLNWPDLL